MIDFKNLKHGSLVRHKGGGKPYTVMANYGDRVTAVRTVDLTNPSEWEQVDEAGEVVPEYYRPVVRDTSPVIDPMPRILVGQSLAQKPPGEYYMKLVAREDGVLVAEESDLDGASHLGKLDRESMPMPRGANRYLVVVQKRGSSLLVEHHVMAPNLEEACNLSRAHMLPGDQVVYIGSGEKLERFQDGKLKPFLNQRRYEELRDDDRFLHNVRNV